MQHARNYPQQMDVYKSKNCYSERTKGGPRGAIYDYTISVRFDSRCFVRWFNEVFLENVKDKQGTKVLLGDNLASHFTPEVTESSVVMISFCISHSKLHTPPSTIVRRNHWTPLSFVL